MLGTSDPSCASDIGLPSGIAVDHSHNVIYWGITDGTTGVFAMDLTTGVCHTIEAGTAPYGMAINPITQTLIWVIAGHDPSTWAIRTEVHSVSVANLSLFDSAPPTIEIDTLSIPGYHDIWATDVEIDGSTAYLPAGMADDSTGNVTLFVLSLPLGDLSAAPTIEVDTGDLASSLQLAITPTTFYIQTDTNGIDIIDRASASLVGGIWTDQVWGIAVSDNSIYSIVSRGSLLQALDVRNVGDPAVALTGSPAPDFTSYIAYVSGGLNGLVPPTLSLLHGRSSGGNLAITYSSADPSGSVKFVFHAKSTDGSPDVAGLCTITAGVCHVSGLDDAHEYNIYISAAFVRVDNTDPARPVNYIIAESESSSAVAANNSSLDPVVVPPVTPPVPPVTPPAGHPSPIKNSFSGFRTEKSALTPALKKAIRAWLHGKTGFTKVSCEGYTGNNFRKRSSAFITALATARATNTCAYVHQLYPSITVSGTSVHKTTSTNDAIRKTVIHLGN